MKPATFTPADLHALLRELYPRPVRKRYSLTTHAIERAQERWLECTPASARDAIWYVLKHGTPRMKGGAVVIVCGSRACTVAPDGAVMTVWVDGMARMEAKRRKARRDWKARRH